LGGTRYVAVWSLPQKTERTRPGLRRGRGREPRSTFYKHNFNYSPDPREEASPTKYSRPRRGDQHERKRNETKMRKDWLLHPPPKSEIAEGMKRKKFDALKRGKGAAGEREMEKPEKGAWGNRQTVGGNFVH